MGKKGKKSKRQQARSKVDASVDTNKAIVTKIYNKMKKMKTFVFDSIQNRQFDEAASMGRDVITYWASQEKAVLKAGTVLTTKGDLKGSNFFAIILVERCRNLLQLEYCFRKKYGNVIEMYNEFASKYAHVITLGSQNLEKQIICLLPMEIRQATKKLQVFYELALIRTGNSFCNIPILKSFIVREMKEEPTDDTLQLKKYFVEALRASKEFDNAIELEKKLLCIPNLLEAEPFETAVSLFITYLERYRVEKHQSLQTAKAKNHSLISGILKTIPVEYQQSFNNDTYRRDLKLAFAQWNYLCHKLGDEEYRQDCVENAVGYIESIALIKWSLRDNCSTCHCSSNTPSKLQLVCRDCRVSCYCDIDHQRECWMKNEVEGTRLGHKVFCHVLNAFRIWMEATDEERKAKMRRRFEKECIAFLAYGLGLKDKCFDFDDIES